MTGWPKDKVLYIFELKILFLTRLENRMYILQATLFWVLFSFLLLHVINIDKTTRATSMA